MKGKFNKSGILFIERKGTMIEQYCPRSASSIQCRHWCPLLQETVMLNKANVTLCNGVTLIFNEFIDERETNHA